MAGNPRIDDLRKRIEKDPGSRLFAQLAEELRKDGELEDAIRVAREGLQKHPSYPSARMTLGRALLDTGDWAAARTEFELVLKSAADNILASRYLAECLENLGDREAAVARYKATLAMAPGEKHVLARLQDLEKGTTSGAAPAARSIAAPRAVPVVTTGLRPGSTRPAPPALAPAAPAAGAPPPMAAPPRPPAPTPIPLSMVEGEMELETSGTGPPSAAPAPATVSVPIPLVAADEEFELERPYDSPTTSIGKAPAATAAPTPTAATAPGSAEDQEFELEAPHETPSTAWAASIRPLPLAEEGPRPAPPRPPVAPTPMAPAMTSAGAPLDAPPPAAAQPASAPPAPAPSALISATLGELYFNQGFTDKAIEVYRELSAREPSSERLSARLRELEMVRGTLAGDEPVLAAPGRTGEPAPDAVSAAADRRQAIERTIVRLEGLLSTIRKG